MGKLFVSTIAACALGLGLILAPAFAQSPTPAPPTLPPLPPPNGPRPPPFPDERSFHAFGEQMRRLHRQARSQILAALAPAHRTLLANIVGGLAIAQNPNVDEAAARLNAALSSGEKDAILRIHQDTTNKIHAMMPALPSGMGMHHAPPADAGHILLMVASPPSMMYMETLHTERGG